MADEPSEREWLEGRLLGSEREHAELPTELRADSLETIDKVKAGAADHPTSATETFSRRGAVFGLLGVPVVLDETLEPGTVQLRDRDGNVLAEIRGL